MIRNIAMALVVTPNFVPLLNLSFLKKYSASQIRPAFNKSEHLDYIGVSTKTIQLLRWVKVK